MSLLPHDPRHSPHPGCPRCAYDLSGEIARWADQCPTTGICPECGLDVDWRDVLVRKYNYPEWFFETASEQRFRAFRITIFLSLMPRRLWTDVRLHHPVHIRRAIFAGVAGFAGLYTLLTFASIVSSPVFPSASRASGGWYLRDALHWPITWLWPRSFWMAESRYSWWMCIGLLTLALMPLSMRLLPISLRRVQVHPAHLVRIAAYSLPFTAITLFMPMLLNRRTGLGATALVLVLWPAVWWSLACKHYLKLPRPVLIAATMNLLCILGVVTFLVVTLRGLAYRRLFEALGL